MKQYRIDSSGWIIDFIAPSPFEVKGREEAENLAQVEFVLNYIKAHPAKDNEVESVLKFLETNGVTITYIRQENGEGKND